MLLTEEQRLVRDAARRFAAERLTPHTRAWEQAGAIPLEVLHEMGRLGYMGATVDPDFGGAGMDYVSYALAVMEINSGDAAVGTVMSVNNAPVCSILANACSPEQKRRWLPPVASGEMIGAFALTEPHAGSDASNLRTRAVRDGADYVLNGTKQFITSGRIAGLAITFASTDPAVGKRGITAFLVPGDAPGLRVASVEEKLGQKASDTCQLAYENVRVDASLRIGEEGDGYRIALANLETGRIGIAAQSVGIAQAALDAAVAYAGEREAFGGPIGRLQAVGFRLADAATRLEAARQLVLHAAALKDAGEPCLKEACMAKLFASEAAENVCSDAIQTFGGYGYVQDFLVEKYYRDQRVCQIYEGTSDIQKLLISRALLG